MNERVYRGVWTVEIVWTEPRDQDHRDDWGAVLSNAIFMDDKPCAWDLTDGDVVELVPKEKHVSTDSDE